jgi:hypothetical protein
VREHDGFFVRLSSGFSAWSESLQTREDSDVYGGLVEGQATGIATAGDLSIGASISRRLVLALTLQTTQLLASNFRQTESSAAPPPAELDPGLRQLFLIGPTLIAYMNERGGFFLEGGLGLAALTPSNASGVNRDDDEVYAAGGAGLQLSIGQQWFFAEQFSVGVRGRATLVVAAGKDQDDVEWLHVVGASPAVLLDVVYH